MCILHYTDDVIIFPLLILLSGNHVANSFVNLQNLVRFEVFAVIWDQIDEINDVWLLVLVVDDSEFMFCEFGYLQKCFCSHILNTWVLLMHEFVEFSDYRF